MKLIASIALALTACAPAMAQVYKCPDAGGRTVIQQVPCAGGKELSVKPASGHAATMTAAPASSGDSAAKPMTEAERINAKTDASARERRRRELQTIVLPEARAAMYAHRDRCAAEQNALKARQYDYVQNLYGKTHAAQIASEMAAKSAQCDTQDRTNLTQFNTLLTECKGLGGCANITP